MQDEDGDGERHISLFVITCAFFSRPPTGTERYIDAQHKITNVASRTIGAMQLVYYAGIVICFRLCFC